MRHGGSLKDDPAQIPLLEESAGAGSEFRGASVKLPACTAGPASSSPNVLCVSDVDPLTRLALAAGRGDRRALDEFMRATEADVWRTVAFLADPGSADDLTQETFLRVIGALPRFAGRSSARTWLLSIARRVVVDQIRRNQARPRITTGVDVEELVGASPAAGRFEDVVEIRMLVEGLEPDRRDALVLTQVLGLSYAEAAEVCGCPLGTIRSRVARARDDLIAAARRDNRAG